MEDRYQKYQNKAFTSEQWHILKKAIDEDIDVTGIANEKFSAEKMSLLIQAREHHIDISAVMDPGLTEEQMSRIIEHVAEEMGIYDEHYENVRRKWLKNTTWIISILAVLIAVCSMLFITKDDWMKYFQELYLKFNVEVVTLETGQSFEPSAYIKAYDPQATIKFPDKKNVDIYKPGPYWVTYEISNGKKNKDMKLLVNVVDKKPPAISLSVNEIKVEKGSKLDPLDYLKSVIDDVDGNITDKVQTSMQEDTILYMAADSSGNKVEKALHITYYEKPVPAKKPDPKGKQNKEPDKTNENVRPVIPYNPGVAVTAENRNFPFEEGKSFDMTYQECMNYGASATASGKANKAECTIYDDENGIHKGYTITFN